MNNRSRSDFKSLTAQQQLALYGTKAADGTESGNPETSVKGCAKIAVQKLTNNGSWTVAAPTAEDISSNSFATSLKDSEVEAVIARWSSCMAAKGFKYASPLAALAAANLKLKDPNARELKTAAADYACKVTTNPISVWQGVETRIQNKQIETRSAKLVKENSGKNKALATARLALSSHNR